MKRNSTEKFHSRRIQQLTGALRCLPDNSACARACTAPSLYKRVREIVRSLPTCVTPKLRYCKQIKRCYVTREVSPSPGPATCHRLFYALHARAYARCQMLHVGRLQTTLGFIPCFLNNLFKSFE